PVLKEQMQPRSTGTGLGKRMVAALRHSAPLLVLGLVRLWSVKGLDYAEHVTEYGVHWNFFFTLGLLPPFVALFHSAFKVVRSYTLLAILLGVTYQIALDSTNLTAYILTAPRNDLISKNREGICSFIGYLAIFLAGQATGMDALPREQPNLRSDSTYQRLKRSLLAQLSFSSALWVVLYVASTSYYGANSNVSRRLANFSYFLWVAAFNSTQITICCAIEKACFPNLYNVTTAEQERRKGKEATSPVLRAFNRNGLAVFLWANLLTGAVNLSVKTLEMGTLGSMGILVGYLGVLSAVALGLDFRDISIKL
ncbi:hypothetical protein LTS18_004067, partial [Coniosporium uncinatum]